MKSLQSALVRSLAATFLGVLASVAVVSTGLAIHEASDARSLPDFFRRVNFAGILFVSVAALFFGLLPALLVFAPIFAVAAEQGRATLALAVVLGAAPGVLLLALEVDLAGSFLVFGVPAAIMSYFIFRQLGAKKSATTES